MAFKLIESAKARWRAVNAPHLVALVRAGAIFRDAVLAERPEQVATSLYDDSAAEQHEDTSAGLTTALR